MLFSSFYPCLKKWDQKSCSRHLKVHLEPETRLFFVCLVFVLFKQWVNSEVFSSLIGYEKDKLITVVFKHDSRHRLQRKLLTTALVVKWNVYMQFLEFIFYNNCTFWGGFATKRLDFFFFFTDWHLGPTKWPEHYGQSEGEDNQCVRFFV